MFKGKCPYMHVFVQVYVHLCICACAPINPIIIIGFMYNIYSVIQTHTVIALAAFATFTCIILTIWI